mmetsp:Transcript_63317/g.205541  ORF Transcript_63317/g.205541 Transcript_63317/m.205541 type:complete len:280 (+) Transcript_63317:1403-2242(+)
MRERPKAAPEQRDLSFRCWGTGGLHTMREPGAMSSDLRRVSGASRAARPLGKVRASGIEALPARRAPLASAATHGSAARRANAAPVVSAARGRGRLLGDGKAAPALVQKSVLVLLHRLQPEEAASATTLAPLPMRNRRRLVAAIVALATAVLRLTQRSWIRRGLGSHDPTKGQQFRGRLDCPVSVPWSAASWAVAAASAPRVGASGAGRRRRRRRRPRRRAAWPLPRGSRSRRCWSWGPALERGEGFGEFGAFGAAGGERVGDSSVGALAKRPCNGIDR